MREVAGRLRDLWVAIRSDRPTLACYQNLRLWREILRVSEEIQDGDRA